MKKRALKLVFAQMSEKSLESLEAITKLHYVEKNGILHYEGEIIDYACFLARGKVEIYKMDKNDNELFLCYVDCLSQGKRLINAFGDFVSYETNANVKGAEPSEIVMIELDKLSVLVQKNLEISNFLYTRIDYFNQTQRQIIARELNIQIETLSRILQKMFQQGLIAKDEHNDIYIKDTTLFTKIFGNMKKID
ncbi:Crp/Fnr family transcriptional regulator [Helicobacter japonicus]|uniref:Crp/Fnr family transcriptional regulator n=1 Tax=Helicobacter japonicus TaxID=425400 RepID=UPI0025B4CADB|nr:helix-turn-helix domain-containing protein [Helicobacter japonicus]